MARQRNDRRDRADPPGGSGSRTGLHGGGLSRRQLLRGAGAAASASVLPAPAHAARHAEDSGAGVAARLGEAPVTLEPPAYATLEAACARIVPSDEAGPGAREAKAARFIDLALGGALASELKTYVAGLAALDAYARETQGTPFHELGEDAQDAALIALQDGTADDLHGISAGAFFVQLRTHTLQGTFSDPYYGGNAGFIGWDLIGYPGVRLGVSGDLTALGVEPAPNHLSAYDFGMFEEDER